MPRTAPPGAPGSDGAARATARLTAGYLLLMAPLLPLGGATPVRVALMAAHLAGAAAILALDRRRASGAAGSLARILADWLPLLLVPLFYLELPLLMEGVPGPVRYHDPPIVALERALFGGQPAFEWAGAWPLPALSELLHACYVSYYPLIYVPPFLLYVGLSGSQTTAGERARAFHDTALALALCFFFCFAIFVVFPVQGPRYLGVPAGVPDGPVRRLALAILEGASSRGAAFPSSHVAVAVTQALLARRHQRPLGRAVALVALGLGAGAVYGGFHYGVDALTGAAVGAAVVPVASRIAARWAAG